MPALTRQQYLQVLTETTVGTANAPSLGASAVKTYELDFQPISANTNTERAPFTGVLGATEIDVAGAFEAAVKCKTYLSGSGTAGTAPSWAPFMIGCGWQQVWSVGASIVLKPATGYAPGAWTATSNFAGMDSLTIHSLMGDTAGTSNAKLWRTRGCMGDFTLDFEFGKPAVFSWDFKGAYVAASDDQTWTASTLTADADPVACMNVGMTWDPDGAGGPHTMVVRKFSLKNGANVIMRPDMNSNGGYKSALVTDRRITYSMEVEVPADFDLADGGADWFGHLTQTTAAHGVLEIGTVGGTSGNIWALNIPKAGFSKVTSSSGDGIMLFTIEGACATGNLSAGADEVTLTLT